MTDYKNNRVSLHIQKNVILGLLILVPIWLTLYFAYLIFIFLVKFTYPIVADLPIHSNKYVMYILSFFLSLISIYLIGVLTNMWLGEQILNFINKSIKNIPILGSFYKSLKQLAETFNNKEHGEHKVVLINFPNDDMKTIGFLIKVVRDSRTDKPLACVFVPTTPNPTGGYLEIIPLEKTMALSWTFEEAMAFIISGGASMPNKDLTMENDY